MSDLIKIPEGITIKDYCRQRLLNYIRLKGYSNENTYKSYRTNLETVLRRFPDPSKANLLQVQNFASEFKNDYTRKNICVILRWLFNKVYNYNIEWHQLPYPKKKKKIQPIYRKEDILKVLNAIRNPKQKAILALIIDCGLRVSEPCSILLSDCNSKERSIIIRGAKGDNDRFAYPSESVWDLIRAYWSATNQKPEKYLFEGWPKDKPYSEESIRQFLRRYCNEVGVKYLGVHAIRRFTGTWWAENGVPHTVASQKLGHQSVKTYERHYLIHSPTYLKNVASPLAEAKHG